MAKRRSKSRRSKSRRRSKVSYLKSKSKSRSFAPAKSKSASAVKSKSDRVSEPAPVKTVVKSRPTVVKGKSKTVRRSKPSRSRSSRAPTYSAAPSIPGRSAGPRSRYESSSLLRSTRTARPSAPPSKITRRRMRPGETVQSAGRAFMSSTRGRHLARTSGRGGVGSSRIVQGGMQQPIAAPRGGGASHARRSMRGSSGSSAGGSRRYQGEIVMGPGASRGSIRSRVDRSARSILDPRTPGSVKAGRLKGPAIPRNPRGPRRRTGSTRRAGFTFKF